ncbi:MAG: hypothetical protein JRG95_15450 [Deltaproteobacteria bacterium]|nr:hypothetical protein [Deltaproteobacteria bacterium]
MNRATPTAIVTLPSVFAVDQLASITDLDADGKDDLVWNMQRRASKKVRRRRGRGKGTTHYVVVWFSNGMQAPDAAVAASSYSAYQIGGLSDVDGNGVGDLAIQIAGKTWGAEIERRKVTTRSKSRKRRRGRRRSRSVTRWATQWNAADGGPAPEWQVLAP